MQVGPAFRAIDCGTSEQNGELFGGAPQAFIQHPAPHFVVRERGHGRQRHRGELGAEVIVKILAKCHVFQLVRLVRAIERAFA